MPDDAPRAFALLRSTLFTAKPHTHRRAQGALVLLFLSLALLSCQRQDDVPPDAFVVLMDTSPKGFDPRFAVDDASAKLIALIHAGLVSVDTVDGKPELELAASIEQPSPTRYEVKLRPGLRFHDGTPLTAEDVEYTFMQLDSPKVKSALAGVSRRIKSFTVHDALRMTIELHEPHAGFMMDLALGIVPKRLCEPYKQCPEPIIGAGPFKLVGQRGDQSFSLSAFDDYVQGRSPLDHVVMRVVKDDNTRLLALLGGTADLVQNAVNPLMMPVVEGQPRLKVQTTKSFKYTYLAFNLRDERLKDVRVRQAIAYGLDRPSIIKHKYRGLATLSTGLISPGHWAYEPDVMRFDYNVERARALLDEAGYPDPDGPDGPAPRLELELKVSSNKFRRALALLMAHQLERIGVRVKVRSYEWGTYFADIKSGNFEMTTLQWPSILDPGLYHWIFHSKNIPSPDNRSAGANRGAYRNAQLDALLDQARSETDMTRLKALYGQVQQILARDVPYVSLWHEDNVAILKAHTVGYYTTPNARYESLKVTRRGP